MSTANTTNTMISNGTSGDDAAATSHGRSADENNHGQYHEGSTTTTTKITMEAFLALALKMQSNHLLQQQPKPLSTPPSVIFTNVTKLDLPNCGLSSLPNDMPTAFPNLSIFFLSGNSFQELPAMMGDFPKLQMMAFRGNRMKAIHPQAFRPNSPLRWLILTDNQLQELPSSIGYCTLLQKCMLSGNRLTELPQTMKNCTRLELIRLASNCLHEPPMHVLQLPNLCWVGLADNPFLPELEQHTHDKNVLPVLSNVDMTRSVILGSGAGGVTRTGIWHRHRQGEQGRDAVTTTVAVKTFREGITSDGWPEHERSVTQTVSDLNCPSLGVKVYGVIKQNNKNGGNGNEKIGKKEEEEDDEEALVMEYLENYQVLAGPPSLETCSRDVYPTQEVTSWKRSCAETLLFRLLDAIVQLHLRAGICHGDLYAHNVLYKRNDETNELLDVRVTDFGAAFYYDQQSEYGAWLQKIELRAFTVLVEEIATHIIDAKSCPATAETFQRRIYNCRQEEAHLEHVYTWWQEEHPTSSIMD